MGAISIEEAKKFIEVLQGHISLFKTNESINEFNKLLLDQWNQRATEPSRSEKKKPFNLKGFVYLMIDSSLNYENVKIGFSKKPSYRESTLQAEKPSIEMVFSIEGTLLYEKKLHDHFADNRIRGEWFAVSKNDVIEYIKTNPPQ